ncbi:alpha-(1,3)-fucosyltransferase C-like isoform X1 [Argopecten irradians]|uniref:alpha-(1,3)-fucosyltransferase C-like isoform X1 n=1 Tax=Argopecten irradians TaxID=31199 RepID=UPI00371A5B3E
MQFGGLYTVQRRYFLFGNWISVHTTSPMWNSKSALRLVHRTLEVYTIIPPPGAPQSLRNISYLSRSMSSSAIDISRNKTQYVLFGTLVITCFSLTLYLAEIISDRSRARYHSNMDQPAFLEKPTSNIKSVLYYNRPEWVTGKEFEGCEYPCIMTSDVTKLSSVGAVIFHGPNTKPQPPEKSPGQIWIMHGMESPINYRNDLSQWGNVFNWTFTYRRDSDVVSTYSGFLQKSNEIAQNYTAIWKTKDNASAWMVSHCSTQSKREQYVKRLQNITNIHVYGGCGKFKCSRSTDAQCMNLLKTHYKFYVAFENSLCVDYVTEKGFKTYTHSPTTIPVMRGGMNYSMFFPPGSYLNSEDFDSAYTLGRKLNTLMAVKIDMIGQFFSWRKHVSINRNVWHNSWCSLCTHIHHAWRYKRVYANINHWLKDSPRSECKAPSDITK